MWAGFSAALLSDTWACAGGAWSHRDALSLRSAGGRSLVPGTLAGAVGQAPPHGLSYVPFLVSSQCGGGDWAPRESILGKRGPRAF